MDDSASYIELIVLTLSIILDVHLTVYPTLGQVIFTTVPNTNNGPAYVFVEEGTLNVSLYCQVNSNNIQIQTRWLVKRSTDIALFVLDFNTAGELISPADLVGKITAIGDVILGISLTYETNLTILNFTSEFDHVQIQCGLQGFELRKFNLVSRGKNV